MVQDGMTALTIAVQSEQYVVAMALLQHSPHVSLEGQVGNVDRQRSKWHLMLLCVVGSVDGLGLRDAEEFRRRRRALDRRSDRCGFPGYGRDFPVLCAAPLRVANRL